MSPEEIIKKCNDECQNCIDDFNRCGLQFSPNLCKYCQNGAELHKALCQVNSGESKWGEVDWNSARYKSFYKG